MVPPKILGLVTIEDVIELIIADEIYDEADFDAQFDNNVNLYHPEEKIDNNKTSKRNLKEKFDEKFS